MGFVHISRISPCDSMAKASSTTSEPAPVPTHPIVYVLGAALCAALVHVFQQEILTPQWRAQVDYAYFYNKWLYILLPVLLTPHVTYMFIWWAPNRFCELAEKNAICRYLSGGRGCDLMHFLVTRLKTMQFISVFLYMCYLHDITVSDLRPSDIVHIFDRTTPLRAAVGIVWWLIGQTLNFGVYNAIGKDGVNYGFKLGAPVPWVTCFPYNLGLRHAQCLGCQMSVIGAFVTFATPKTSAVLAFIGFTWIIYYVYSSWMEASSDADTSDDKLFDPKVDKKGDLA